MSLKVYNRKRKFDQTPEPKGKKVKGSGDLRFVVQMHDATRLHWDLRLEFDGVFKSWAVPKGPSLNPLDQRLAVFVEDHPIEYGSFEGIIPKGNYGAGTVMIWDEGTYIERGSTGRKDSEAAMKKAFEKGHITFVVSGQKLNGEFALIKLKKDAGQKAWLLVKKRDEFSTYKKSEIPDNNSVKTGRSIEEIAEESEAAGNVWLPKQKKQNANATKTVAKNFFKSAPIEKSKIDFKKTAAKEPMPRKIKPMLPTASRYGVEGQWIFEPLLDGYRTLAEIEGKKVHLYSKSGISFDKKFPDILQDLKSLNSDLVLDGEIVEAKGKAFYYIYDVLFYAGRDLRKEELGKRKAALKELISKHKYFDLVPEVTATAEKVIAKNLNSHYRAGTTSDWLILETETSSPAKVSRAKKPQVEKKPKSSPKKTFPENTKHNEVQLTNLNKVFFPEDGITKGDVVNYYKEVAPYILPFLKDRPESLNRLPNGIAAPGFYQKDLTGYKPRWLQTTRIFSESADKSIDYVLCQDESSLLYIVNLGCIEINPWFSKLGSLDKPDFLVIDLDPDGNDFDHVIEIAREIHEILDEVGAANFVKTSGATGIHIGIPVGAKYDFDQGREFCEEVCRVIARKHPATTSIERSPARRRKKIYLDFMQNRRGQTLAAPFCIRPKPGAPVSMPLAWKDLKSGVKPEQFNIENALRLIPKNRQHWQGVLGKAINLDKCQARLRKKFKP